MPPLFRYRASVLPVGFSFEATTLSSVGFHMRQFGPWAGRDRTDILGVFMASQACRICSSVLSSHQNPTVAEAFLGQHWREANTEAKAIEIFLKEIEPLKSFAGLYMLRKIDVVRFAYGIFGLSASATAIGYSLTQSPKMQKTLRLQMRPNWERICSRTWKRKKTLRHLCSVSSSCLVPL